MKSIWMAALCWVAFTGCKSVTLIGDLNMISTRNVDSDQDYTLLKTYMGEGKSEIRKSKYKTIDEAVNGTVRNTPGGEYLMNVKLYRTGSGHFAAEGDVWGIKDNVAYKGWKVGDKVQWSVWGNVHTGKIVDLKDAKRASIKDDDAEKIINVPYSKLRKSQ